MIKCVGYADGGVVFFTMIVDVEGKNYDATMYFTTDQAEKFINDLKGALDESLKKVAIDNVRNSSNTH